MTPDPPVLTAVLSRIKTLYPKTIDLSLGRIERLLDKLGSPHLKLPPVVHVAGTNGKGSVIAFMRSILEASGYRVHAYTSPHLISFTERVRLCGHLIDPTVMADLLNHVADINGDEPITFFEMITAAAYEAFAQTPADVLLLETGLGGRLDATNVVPNPHATVLTTIGMDHMSYLGDSLASIAAVKAAIMKEGAPCICAEQHADAAAIIEEVAEARNVSIRLQGRDWVIERDSLGAVRFADAETKWSMPPPRLTGCHQTTNLGLALATLAMLPMSIPSFGLRSGMHQVEWPARCQRINSGPLTQSLPTGWEVWLDGGHNPSAGKALATWIGSNPIPTVAICGMMANKDCAGFLSPLVAYLSGLATVPIPGHDGCIDPDTLAETARDAGFTTAVSADTVEDALEVLKPHISHARGRILICGSLYLAGEVLKTHI